MFLKVEGDRIINIDLVSMVEMNHTHKTATLWDSGIILVPDSGIAYRYFLSPELYLKQNN